MKKVKVDLNKRYWFFANLCYYPSYGLNDLYSSFDELSELKSVYDNFINQDRDYPEDPFDYNFEVYDKQTSIMYKLEEIQK